MRCCGVSWPVCRQHVGNPCDTTDRREATGASPPPWPPRYGPPGAVTDRDPNGVDAARFAAAEPDRRHGSYLLAVGGIEPRKGSIDLLDAYALVRRELPDLRLVIAGGETLFDYRDYRAAWEARARDLGVIPVVLGPVDHEESPGLVAEAAAFAFPSAKEGFGLAAMEALAAAHTWPEAARRHVEFHRSLG